MTRRDWREIYAEVGQKLADPNLPPETRQKLQDALDSAEIARVEVIGGIVELAAAWERFCAEWDL